MTWVILPARKHFRDYSSKWDELNCRTFQNHPLLDSRFLGPLIEHFATDRELIAVNASGEGAHSMLLLTPAKLGIAKSFLPSQTEISPVLLASIDEVPALLDALPGPMTALELFCQDPEYSAFPIPQCYLKYELTPHVMTVSIELAGDFDEYWLSRSRKLRQNLSRALRRVASAGKQCRLKIIEAPGDIERAVERYGDLEIRGWKGASGTAIHSGNVQGWFYRDLLRRFSEIDRAVVYELYSDDELVSSQLAIGNEFMLITLKTTFNELFRSFSPGHLLDYLMLKHEFGRKRFRQVEFYTNAGPELLRWGTRNRQIQHITIYRNGCIQLLARTCRKLKRLVRQLSPSADNGNFTATRNRNS
jgi:Acetyltransferase (GNAT) domain